MRTPAFLTTLRDPVWAKVATLTTILFFITLSDAVLSFFVPPYLQGVLHSPLAMGMVMSFSSLVGLIADLIFPQLFRSASVGRLVFLAFATSIGFIAALAASTVTPWLIFLLLGMAAWGLYYELLHFAKHQMVATAVPIQKHAGAWGILDAFNTVAYLIGPIIAAGLLITGNRFLLSVAGMLTAAGLGLFLLSRGIRDRRFDIRIEHVSLATEVRRWAQLAGRVWPILVLSIALGLIDAAFWTTGTVWSTDLAARSPWGGLILPVYQLPMLFVALAIPKWGIFRGKKKRAEVFVMIGGLVLFGTGFLNSIGIILVSILAASTFLGLSYPLTEAVYSDIIGRMRREKRHLIGLTSSTTSIAYIIGPVLAGALSSRVAEQRTLSWIGLSVAAVAFGLLFVTPAKLKLPQSDIARWDREPDHGET